MTILWVADHLPDLLTFSSIMVAIVFGVLGYRHSALGERKSHTVNMLENFSTNETLAASDFTMTRLINGGGSLDGEKIADDLDARVINLLDYYEFLATSYVHGVLDQEIILHIRGGPMSRAFAVCESYIEQRRTLLDAPSLYLNFEKMVREYRSRNLGR